MPHSTKIRKQKARVARQLNKGIGNLQKLKQKHFRNAMEIKLTNVSLGHLHDKYRPTHKPLHPAILHKVPNFIRMPIDRSHPLILYGSDKGLLACRVHLHRPDLVQRLSDSIDNLPHLKRQLSGKGIDCGDYES